MNSSRTSFGEVILGLSGGSVAGTLPVWGWVGLGLAVVLTVWASRYLWYLSVFLWYRKSWVRFQEARFTPPFRIHLVAAIDKNWTTEPTALALADELRELGFVEVGVFEIPEMPDAKLHGFVNEPTDEVGTVFKFKGHLWADLGSYYEDGSTITYSTAGVGEELPRPPAQRLIRFPEMTLAALHHRLTQDRPRGRLRRVARQTYVELLEGAHAGFQDWLAERGGYTIDELRTLMPAREGSTAEGLPFLREKAAREALINWWRTQPGAPIQAEEIDDCSAIVHDDLSMEQTIFMFCRATGDWGAGEKHIPANAKSPRAAFRALNEVRKGGLVKFWEKTTPLIADFYRHQGEPEDFVPRR